MRAKTWKALIVAALAVVILTAAVGGTMAWLSTQTQDLTNTFEPAKVTCKVDENFTEGGTEKKDVRIQNTGTTDAYIRVAVIGTRTARLSRAGRMTSLIMRPIGLRNRRTE